MAQSSNRMSGIRLTRNPAKCLLAPAADLLKQLLGTCMTVGGPSYLCPQRVATAAGSPETSSNPLTPWLCGGCACNTNKPRTNSQAANVCIFWGILPFSKNEGGLLRYQKVEARYPWLEVLGLWSHTDLE